MTFKNERLVAQISDSNKKQLIIDAANIMFNKDSIPVTVRLAQSGDKVVQSNVPISQHNVIAETKQEEKPASTQEQALSTQKISSNLTEEPLSSENVERLESDQEKMVLDLFDGKYVE